MSTALLLSDPEPATRVLLERHLRHDGFELVAGSGRRPDLVLAGDEAELDRWRGEAPVIVLGRIEAEPLERVRAFRRGCDDYVARPFQYDELIERIRAVLRRVTPPERDVLVAGPIEIDLHTRVVRARGVPVALSQKEYGLLACLAGEPTRVFTKEELLRDVWGYQAQARTRTLDSHASRLRRKLRAVDPATTFIENVWGVGYRLLGLHGV
ncbi:MAG TPA: response regulator transcription factor [Gaiellaceae bacterium]|nr:response regulator transcription factor [Gaiellaceae bacterium]